MSYILRNVTKLHTVIEIKPNSDRLDMHVYALSGREVLYRLISSTHNTALDFTFFNTLGVQQFDYFCFNFTHYSDYRSVWILLHKINLTYVAEYWLHLHIL